MSGTLKGLAMLLAIVFLMQCFLIMEQRNLSERQLAMWRDQEAISEQLKELKERQVEAEVQDELAGRFCRGSFFRSMVGQTCFIISEVSDLLWVTWCNATFNETDRVGQ